MRISMHVPRLLYTGVLFGGALLLATAPARAGIGAGTQRGPCGGSIQPLAADPAEPSVIYAGSNAVFRSSDGGESWAFSAAPGVTDLPPVSTLAVVDGVVIVGATFSGI